MLEILIYAVGIPVIVTGGVLVLVGQPWRASNPATPMAAGRQRALQAASAIGIAASYCICHLGLHGVPAGSVLEAWEWLLLLAPLAALAVILRAVFEPAAGIRLVALIILAGATGWFLVPSFQTSPWLWRSLLGGAVFVLAVSQSHHADRFARIVLPFSWILVGACGLPVLIASANAKFGFFATSIAAASGASGLVSLLCRTEAIARGAFLVTAILYPSIFFSGYFNDYGDVPRSSFLLLAAAPLGLWMGTLVSRFNSKGWQVSIVGILTVAVLCFAAIYLAWPAMSAEPAY